MEQVKCRKIDSLDGVGILTLASPRSLLNVWWEHWDHSKTCSHCFGFNLSERGGKYCHAAKKRRKNKKRQYSCVNARGIPPAVYQVHFLVFSLPGGEGGIYPSPGQGVLQCCPVGGGTPVLSWPGCIPVLSFGGGGVSQSCSGEGVPQSCPVGVHQSCSGQGVPHPRIPSTWDLGTPVWD